MDVYHDHHAVPCGCTVYTIYTLYRYGARSTHNMCQVLSSIPASVTPSQKLDYFQKYTGIEHDAALVMARVKESSLIDAFVHHQTFALPLNILAPPTSQCLKCSKSLVKNHTCRVIIYTLTGVLHAEKLTTRCLRCNLYYNYDKWGNKHDIGFSWYPSPRKYVEVNDTTYFDRKLLEFQCSLA